LIMVDHRHLERENGNTQYWRRREMDKGTTKSTTENGGLVMLHRNYHRADIGGLRFELAYLQFSVAIKIQQLAAQVVLLKRDELMAMIQERFNRE